VPLEGEQFPAGLRIPDLHRLVQRGAGQAFAVGIESKKVALPAKFADPETSGLSVEIKKGKSPVNFMLSGR
jgi:hypothetical protein